MPPTTKPIDGEPWLGLIAEHVSAGVVIVDGQGAVRFASSAAHQLLQAYTDEALQLSVRDLLRAMGGDERLEIEPGDERPGLLVERESVDRSGYLLLLRDASQQRASDMDLLLANRMRGLEALYRAMAHDLKSPLQAIVLNIDLLRTSMRGADLEDEAQRKVDGYLDVIQSEISRLGRSIQALLSQAGPGADGKRRVDLRRIQREVVALLEPSARRKRIRLHTSMPRRSVTVLGNRDRLKQAVLNLAVNAIEAMDRQGNLEFELATNDSAAYFEVRDDGPGIPAELQSKVFDPHFTTKKTGTGIGLGVARSVGRAHGGELELLPREPRGTVARLRLPLVAPRR